MDVTTVINLVIALCRYLEVPPENLAKFFVQRDDNQEFYDLFLAAYREAGQ